MATIRGEPASTREPRAATLYLVEPVRDPDHEAAMRDCVAWIIERAANAYWRLLLGEADVLRTSEFEHAVQHVDPNGDLGRATPVHA